MNGELIECTSKDEAVLCGVEIAVQFLLEEANLVGDEAVILSDCKDIVRYGSNGNKLQDQNPALGVSGLSSRDLKQVTRNGDYLLAAEQMKRRFEDGKLCGVVDAFS
ncbi:hypothetical protein PIB30_040677 [Stylosanthes scabra]|uniref:RNase H type-1 domain-containing protein n=1 Tax=Stylosanthes scabra TaxID=79078 RepID=A0ABU6QES3_9FABA|nr:hypothetical protein [Stylosanthes scabra]